MNLQEMGNDMAAERDEKGRFIAGHGPTSPGRPRKEAAEKCEQALIQVVSNGTLAKWTAAMKRRLEKGDLKASEFVFDRLYGKPEQRTGSAADDALAWLVSHWADPVGDSDCTNAGAIAPSAGEESESQ